MWQRSIDAQLVRAGVLLAIAMSAAQLWAATADELVREALHREIYGKAGERQQLLEQAAALAPGNEAVMWHRGFVRYRGLWIKADEGTLAERDNALAEYHRVREQYADTAEGQTSLADWCRDRSLTDQERAHLTRVVDIDPDNVAALRRLGFRPVGGDWISAAELQQSQAERQQRQQSLSAWRGRIEDIRNLLRHASGRRRALGEERLSAIHDVGAIPAIEQILGTESEKVALDAVAALHRMNGREATLALARQAVLSRWSDVRNTAVKRLRERDQERYVPELLAAMYTPVTSRMSAYRTARGDVALRQSLRREGQDQFEELVLDGPARAVSSAQVMRENLRTRQLNERIADTLNLATDQSLPASPEAWWEWWNEENEVFLEGGKPLHSVRPTEQLARLERFRDAEQQQRAREAAEWSRSDARRQWSQNRRRDCLAAGTIVWTATGPVAVEKIQIGDLVLSQDVESGELAYKPVLRTTIRPTTTLVKIQAGDETIEASGGHPFWVSGEGWVKARDLASGMELHCADGTMRITIVDDGREQPSYNLIVADFNSYFVGKARVLSHDNTVRRVTDAVVPGLIDR